MMRATFAVLFLFVAFAASYPSAREAASDDQNESDLELELRSILNHLTNEQDEVEQMRRSAFTENDAEDDDDDDSSYLFNKRQGGLNIVDKQSKCEIQCIHTQRNPPSGKGKSIKEAAKICKQKCPFNNKRRTDNKGSAQKPSKHSHVSLRQFDEESDSAEQQYQRRAFYDYLMEQLQQNNE